MLKEGAAGSGVRGWADHSLESKPSRNSSYSFWTHGLVFSIVKETGRHKSGDVGEMAHPLFQNP